MKRTCTWSTIPKRNWQNRTHFVAAAAQLMRRIMVDHARERRAQKRGGGAVKIELDDAALGDRTQIGRIAGVG